MDAGILASAALFDGLGEDEVAAALSCLNAREGRYRKGEFVLRAGDVTDELGIVCEGSVRIENTDAWGNTLVLSHVGAGQVFAEAYACLPGEPLMVDVVASHDARVAFLSVRRILSVCPSACPRHLRLVTNLVAVLSRKNLALSRRSFHVGQKSVRGKIRSYLSHQALLNGSNAFDVPFTRQQLADYLGMDRTVLSAELGKMQKEGLLRVRRSHFELTEP